MSQSFLDQLRRESKAKDKLQYDDGAFYYFFSAFTLIVLVPLGTSIIQQLLSKRHRFVLNKEVAPNLLGHNIQSFMDKKEKKSRINKALLYKIVLACFLVYAYSQLVSNDIQARELKEFDPYDILGLEKDIDPVENEKEIKKAYRTLSKKCHPDLFPNDAKKATQFILLTKAYECLTNEEKYKNWKNYGNPEGDKTFSVSIALPEFLLNKENRVPILIVFFTFILVVVPYIVFSWYNEVSKYDMDGTLAEDKKIFIQHLNENLIMKNVPKILASCLEFEPILSVSSSQNHDLSQLHRDVTDITGKQPIEQKLIKPNDLYLAYMMGLNVPASLVEDTLFLLQKTPVVIESMIYFALKVPRIRVQNGIKNFGLRCAMSLIDFSQHFYQGLWQGDSPLLQISVFDKTFAESILKKKKKLPEFEQLVKEANLKDGPGFDLDDKMKAAMEELVDFPYIDVKPELYVEDEKDIRLGDIVTLKVTITRLNLNHKDQSFKYLKSNRYPYNEREKWYVFVGDDRRNLIIMSEICSTGNKTSEHKFMFPADNIGTFQFKVWVRSNGYLGLDHELDVMFTVQDRVEKTKYEIHPEDLAVKKEPTLFEQLTTGAKDENASDEELEDDDDDGHHGHGHHHGGHEHGPGCSHDHGHDDDEDYEDEVEIEEEVVEEIPKNKKGKGKGKK